MIRHEIFDKNLEEINHFNELADKTNISFRFGVNQFTEYKYDEFVSLFTGLRYNRNDTIETSEVKKDKNLIEKLYESVPSYKSKKKKHF